jgi:hypothetical protein
MAHISTEMLHSFPEKVYTRNLPELVQNSPEIVHNLSENVFNSHQMLNITPKKVYNSPEIAQEIHKNLIYESAVRV